MIERRKKKKELGQLAENINSLCDVVHLTISIVLYMSICKDYCLNCVFMLPFHQRMVLKAMYIISLDLDLGLLVGI